MWNYRLRIRLTMTMIIFGGYMNVFLHNVVENYQMHQKENNYIKAFESKVIMYLFEDVMKMRPENIFIGHHKKNGKMIFSEICKAFEQDVEGIFGIEDLENI